MVKGNEVLTSGEVAKLCHVAQRTAQKWIDEGLLKGYIIPGTKVRRVTVDELVKFLKKYDMPMLEKLADN